MAPARSGERCAQITRALDEPMSGTAPSTRRWLCLERPAPWFAEITQDHDPAVQALLARAAFGGFRPLLISGPAPDADQRPIRILLADTAPGSTVMTTVAVEEPARLGDLPLPGLDDPLPGEPVTGPLLLICTHGERDPCCGIDGRDLARVLNRRDVYECSHLGGHRFAPTALVLPTGYVYGRLNARSAWAVLRAAARNEVVTDGCRGRCTWSPRGQVAELAVRNATGSRSPDALTVQDDTGDAVHVADLAGERWAVDLEQVDSGFVRPASCGARPAQVALVRAAEVRPLPALPMT
jgi:Sucrase/ferredoxin-like